MRDTILLIGTEDVTRAAQTISGAAERMAQVQGWESEALAQHRAFMTDWIERFERAVDRIAPPSR